MTARVRHAMKTIMKKNVFGDFLLDQLTLVSVSKGKVCVEMQIEEAHQNLYGTLHGGMSATLVDLVSTLALHASEQNANYGVSIDMNVTYLAAGHVGSTILIESETLKVGSRLAFLTVDIKDKESGKLLVQGRQTKLMTCPS